jgi:hypothetical protein
MKQSVLSKQVGFSIPKKWKSELFLSPTKFQQRAFVKIDDYHLNYGIRHL